MYSNRLYFSIVNHLASSSNPFSKNHVRDSLRSEDDELKSHAFDRGENRGVTYLRLGGVNIAISIVISNIVVVHGVVVIEVVVQIVACDGSAVI